MGKRYCSATWEHWGGGALIDCDNLALPGESRCAEHAGHLNHTEALDRLAKLEAAAKLAAQALVGDEHPYFPKALRTIDTSKVAAALAALRDAGVEP